MIRVRAIRARPRFGGELRYTAERAWSIWQDGERLPYLVVEHKTGHTIIEATSRKMITVWHAGIYPGNLARYVLGRQLPAHMERIEDDPKAAQEAGF